MLHTPRAAHFARPLAHGLHHGQDAVLDVCIIISNQVRFASRPKLLQYFDAQNNGDHIRLWLCEIAFGNRPHHVTEKGNPRHLQLRTNSEYWFKEIGQNLLKAHVCANVPADQPQPEYFAFVDADVTFARADWAYETLQQLQHYDVVQMFSDAMDVGPKYEVFPGSKRHKGFVWSYYNDPKFMCSDRRFGYTSAGHPGFAWAWRRSALDICGGLYDHGIVGGGDRHMACGLIGTIELSGPSKFHDLASLHLHFRESLLQWQFNAMRLNRNIGYVDGLLVHHWHGRKADRQYGNRWKIYTENQYSPVNDLRRDSQGLYMLQEYSAKLRDDLRSYFRSRNEDSIDLE